MYTHTSYWYCAWHICTHACSSNYITWNRPSPPPPRVVYRTVYPTLVHLQCHLNHFQEVVVYQTYRTSNMPTPNQDRKLDRRAAWLQAEPHDQGAPHCPLLLSTRVHWSAGTLLSFMDCVRDIKWKRTWLSPYQTCIFPSRTIMNSGILYVLWMYDQNNMSEVSEILTCPLIQDGEQGGQDSSWPACVYFRSMMHRYVPISYHLHINCIRLSALAIRKMSLNTFEDQIPSLSTRWKPQPGRREPFTQRSSCSIMIFRMLLSLCQDRAGLLLLGAAQLGVLDDRAWVLLSMFQHHALSSYAPTCVLPTYGKAKLELNAAFRKRTLSILSVDPLRTDVRDTQGQVTGVYVEAMCNSRRLEANSRRSLHLRVRPRRTEGKARGPGGLRLGPPGSGARAGEGRCFGCATTAPYVCVYVYLSLYISLSLYIHIYIYI